MGKYDDIIHLPHPQSTSHKPMTLIDRAAQFAPFAALTGYDAMIEEQKRNTDHKIELSEGEWEEINGKLQFLLTILDQQPVITIHYFVPDKKKDGGSYVQKVGVIRKIDEITGILQFMDKQEISIADIVSITGTCFHDSLE